MLLNNNTIRLRWLKKKDFLTSSLIDSNEVCYERFRVLQNITLARLFHITASSSNFTRMRNYIPCSSLAMKLCYARLGYDYDSFKARFQTIDDVIEEFGQENLSKKLAELCYKYIHCDFVEILTIIHESENIEDAAVNGFGIYPKLLISMIKGFKYKGMILDYNLLKGLLLQQHISILKDEITTLNNELIDKVTICNTYYLNTISLNQFWHAIRSSLNPQDAIIKLNIKEPDFYQVLKKIKFSFNKFKTTFIVSDDLNEVFGRNAMQKPLAYFLHSDFNGIKRVKKKRRESVATIDRSIFYNEQDFWQDMDYDFFKTHYFEESDVGQKPPKRSLENFFDKACKHPKNSQEYNNPSFSLI